MSRPRSDDPDLLAMLAAFLGTTPEALAGADADAMRARLGAVRGAIGRLMAAAAAAEPDEARRGSRPMRCSCAIRSPGSI